MTQILAIAAADVYARLNPLAEAGLFVVGAGSGEIASSLVEDTIAQHDEMVLSVLPEKYRRMARKVEGETVVEYATAGQSSFTCGLVPVTAGTLFLYVDWGTGGVGTGGSGQGAGGRDWYQFDPGRDVPYAHRTPADALGSTAYTLTPSTGSVALTDPLAEGQKIYADYEHTAMTGCKFLRKIALDLIAADLTKRLPSVTVEVWNSADRDEATAKALLLQIVEGNAGIDTFDNLKLVADYETRAERSGRKLSGTGYW